LSKRVSVRLFTRLSRKPGLFVLLEWWGPCNSSRQGMDSCGENMNLVA
jgi:hypothetical protein